MKKNIGTYAIVGIVTAGAALAGGQVAQMAGGKHLEPEQKEAIHEALESGDYAAWDSIIPKDAKIRNIITEENFDRLQKLHELRASGNKEEAQILREDLGIPERLNQKKHPRLSEEDRAARDAAIASQDYNTFVHLLPEEKRQTFIQHITAENFDEFARMHELRMSGNKEEADEIREALGIPERKHPRREKNKDQRREQRLEKGEQLEA